MSDAAKALFEARAMLWLSIKGKDDKSADWWAERAQSIACAILSTHAR